MQPNDATGGSNEGGVVGVEGVSLCTAPDIAFLVDEGRVRITPDAEVQFLLLLLLARAGSEGCCKSDLARVLWPSEGMEAQRTKLRKRVSFLRTARRVPIRGEGKRLWLEVVVDVESSEEWWGAYRAAMTKPDAAYCGALGLHPMSDACRGLTASHEIDEQMAYWDHRLVSKMRSALWDHLPALGDEIAEADALAQAVLRDLVVLHSERAQHVKSIMRRALHAGLIGPALSVLDRMVRQHGAGGLPSSDDNDVDPALLGVLQEWIDRLSGPGADGGPALEGRVTELRLLLQALARSRAALIPAAVVVEGAAGLGKSQLLQFVVREARQRHFPVVDMRMRRVMQGQPYSGLQMLARELLRLPGVSGLVPRDYLLVQQVAASPLETAGLSRDRLECVLRDALVSVLAEYGDEASGRTFTKPVVFVIDEVEGFDAASMAVLVRVVHDLSPRPVLLALATASLDTIQPTVEALASDVTVLTLAPMTDDQARRILARHLQADAALPEVSDENVARINRNAGGRPRDLAYIAEQIRVNGFDVNGVQQSMDFVIAAQLRRLPDAVRDVLAVLAMLGPVASWARVQAVGVVPHDALEEVKRTDLASGGWIESLSCPCVPEALVNAVLAEVEVTMRSMLWVRVAEVLERESHRMDALRERLAADGLVPGRTFGLPSVFVTGRLLRQCDWAGATPLLWQSMYAWEQAGHPKSAASSGQEMGQALIRAGLTETGVRMLARADHLISATQPIAAVLDLRAAWLMALLDVGKSADAAALLEAWDLEGVDAYSEGRAATMVLRAFAAWYTGCHLDDAQVVALEVVARASYLPQVLRAAAFAYAVAARWERGDMSELESIAPQFRDGSDGGISLQPGAGLAVWRAERFAAAIAREPAPVAAQRHRYGVARELGPRLSALVSGDEVMIARISGSVEDERVACAAAITAAATAEMPTLECRFRFGCCYALLREILLCRSWASVPGAPEALLRARRSEGLSLAGELQEQLRALQALVPCARTIWMEPFGVLCAVASLVLVPQGDSPEVWADVAAECRALGRPSWGGAVSSAAVRFVPPSRRARTGESSGRRRSRAWEEALEVVAYVLADRDAAVLRGADGAWRSPMMDDAVLAQGPVGRGREDAVSVAAWLDEWEATVERAGETSMPPVVSVPPGASRTMLARILRPDAHALGIVAAMLWVRNEYGLACARRVYECGARRWPQEIVEEAGLWWVLGTHGDVSSGSGMDDGLSVAGLAVVPSLPWVGSFRALSAR